MIKHTETIALFECVSPFCGVGAYLVKGNANICFEKHKFKIIMKRINAKCHDVSACLLSLEKYFEKITVKHTL